MDIGTSRREAEMTDEELKELERMGVQVQIDALKAELATYDYIGVKIATGVATIEEYAKQIRHCEKLREKIRELESEVQE